MYVRSEVIMCYSVGGDRGRERRGEERRGEERRGGEEVQGWGWGCGVRGKG